MWYSFAFQIQDNKDELKAKLKEILREKSDAFNSKNPEEDKVKCRTHIILYLGFRCVAMP